jgi:hypothetical protein
MCVERESEKRFFSSLKELIFGEKYFYYLGPSSPGMGYHLFGLVGKMLSETRHKQSRLHGMITNHF